MSVMLAAVLLMQAPTAEGTFKKIEDGILKAKTLSIKYSWERFRNGTRMESLRASLLLKEGNKGRIEYQSPESATTVISDGKNLRVATNGKVTVERATPESFREDLCLGISRAGATTYHLLVGIKGAEKASPFRAYCTVDAFKLGSPGEETGSLTYQAHVTGDTDIYEGEMTYNSKDLRLLKRQLKLSSKGTVTLWSEKYDEFTLNADIADDTFKLPEK